MQENLLQALWYGYVPHRRRAADTTLKDEPASAEINWVQELHDLVKLQAVCRSQDANKVREGTRETPKQDPLPFFPSP